LLTLFDILYFSNDGCINKSFTLFIHIRRTVELQIVIFDICAAWRAHQLSPFAAKR